MTLAVGRNFRLEDALREAEACYVHADPNSRTPHQARRLS